MLALGEAYYNCTKQYAQESSAATELPISSQFIEEVSKRYELTDWAKGVKSYRSTFTIRTHTRIGVNNIVIDPY